MTSPPPDETGKKHSEPAPAVGEDGGVAAKSNAPRPVPLLVFTAVIVAGAVT